VQEQIDLAGDFKQTSVQCELVELLLRGPKPNRCSMNTHLSLATRLQKCGLLFLLPDRNAGGRECPLVALALYSRAAWVGTAHCQIGVGHARQRLVHSVPLHLGRASVVVNRHVTRNHIVDQLHCRGVTGDAHVAQDLVSGANGGRRPDFHRRCVVLELHVANHLGATNRPKDSSWGRLVIARLLLMMVNGPIK